MRGFRPPTHPAGSDEGGVAIRKADLAATLDHLRSEALGAFQRGVEAVGPRERSARETVRILRAWSDRASTPRRLYVLGAGKAACSMALGVEDAVVEVYGARPPFTVCGAVVCPRGGRAPTKWIASLGASHPLPGPDGEAAGRRLLSLAAETGEGDAVVALLSGGASALVATPAPDLSLADLEETTRLLLASGATINEVNAVRKHLSAISGGLLGLAVREARAVCLVVSDVVGDDLSVIGSGPFYGDASTFEECVEIVDSYGLSASLPGAVGRRLERGAAGLLPETPSPSDPRLARIEHRVVASGLDACRAAAAWCEQRGFRPLLVSHTLEGEARELGVMHAGLARGVTLAGVPLPAPCALVSGGEATVSVRGVGAGGRNQESCLAAVPHLAGLPVVFLSAGTDGVDGPTSAAGGLVDGLSAARARGAGVDVGDSLARNDSHAALRSMGDLVVTGATGTNVADLRVVLVGGSSGPRLRGSGDGHVDPDPGPPARVSRGSTEGAVS